MTPPVTASPEAEALAVALRDVTREDVERLSDVLEDPAWLRERRLASWETYERLPVPTIRSEAWRYTDLSRVAWQDTELAVPEGRDDGAPPEPPEGWDPAEAAGRVAVVDGVGREAWLDPELAASGVVFTDLATALRDHEELVRRHLLRLAPPEALAKFPSLHGALVSGGVFLHVPAGVEVRRPLHALRTKLRSRAATFPHTLVVAEPGSRFTYVEESASSTREDLELNAAVTEIVAGDGSEVRIATVQDWGRNVFSYALQRARVGRDATVKSLVATLGGRLSRAEVQSELEAEGGTSEMLGVYLGDGEQHMDHHTLQLHRAPHTNSDLLFKGALLERAHAAFSGLIKVYKGAQRTDAYQKNRNLLLSPDARAESLPNLEIEADDVRCSHGATIGPADELQLFYLRSRGLSRIEAERLLVHGFFEDVLARVPLPRLRQVIREAVDRRAREAQARAEARAA